MGGDLLSFDLNVADKLLLQRHFLRLVTARKVSSSGQVPRDEASSTALLTVNTKKSKVKKADRKFLSVWNEVKGSFVFFYFIRVWSLDQFRVSKCIIHKHITDESVYKFKSHNFEELF